MATATTSSRLASYEIQRQARSGLSVYFAIVVALTAVFQVIVISTGNLSWFLP